MREYTVYTVIQWIYTVATLLLVLNRLYNRALTRARFLGLLSASWSDGLVVVAWLLYLAQNICDAIIYSYGGILSLDPVKSWKSFVIISKIYYVENLVFYIPLYCIKGAILCFFLEIAPPRSVWVRRATWVGIAFTIAGGLSTAVAFTVGCLPLNFWWSVPYYNNGVCPILRTSSIILLWFHVFSDVYIYTIPFFIIRKLNRLNRSQWLVTAGMFGAGFVLICLAVPQLSVGNWDGFNRSVMSEFWFALHEQTLAIVLACLPALRITIKRYRQGRKERSLNGDSTGCDAAVTYRKKRCSVREKVQRGELRTREVAEGSSPESVEKQNGLKLDCERVEVEGPPVPAVAGF